MFLSYISSAPLIKLLLLIWLEKCLVDWVKPKTVSPSLCHFLRTSLERPAVAAKVAGHVAFAPEVAQVAVVVLAVVEHLQIC